MIGPRHRVIHEGAAQRLVARPIVDAALPHRLANPLGDPAVGLAVHDQRVDRPPDIVDRGVAEDLDRPGLGVDLDLADVAAVGKDRGVHLVVRDRGKPGAGSGLEERQAAVGAGDEIPSVRVPDVDRGGLQTVGRRLPARFDQRIGGLDDDRSGHAHRPARMRAAADMDDVGVARHHVDALDGHAQPFGRDLGEAGLMALPARLGSDHQLDSLLGRRDAEPRLLFGRADRGLDVVGESPAAQPAAPFRLRPAHRESVPVREVDRHVEALRVISAVVDHPGGVAVGHLGGRNEIPPAQLHRIDAELPGRGLDQPFDGEDHLGPPGAAVGVGRRGVGKDRARAQPGPPGCGRSR